MRPPIREIRKAETRTEDVRRYAPTRLLGLREDCMVIPRDDRPGGEQTRYHGSQRQARSNRSIEP